MADQPKVDVAAFPALAIKVITNPVGFYREMQKSGGLLEPLIFVVVIAAITGVLVAVLSMMGLGMSGMMAGGFVAIIIVPIVAAIFSFIGAAIMYVIWLIMGSKESFETAYRCVAYASAIYPITTLLGAVPYLGALASIAWGFYLMSVASIEAHKIKAQLAYIVFGVLGALLVLMRLSGEYQMRQFQTMGQFGKNLENMSPEEMGRATGEFMKGLEKAQQK